MNKIQELEDQIMKTWHVVDDIACLSEYVMEDPSLTKDQIANTLIGLEQLYKMRFDKLFRTYEEVCAEYYKNRKRNEGGDYCWATDERQLNLRFNGV